MNIQMEVKGDEIIARKFVNTTVVETEIRQAADKAAAAIHKRAAHYPPQRPGANYRRTRRLGNSWVMAVQPFGGGVHSLVSNPTDYAPEVMDPAKQASIHSGVWATTRQILAEQRQKILGFYSEAVRRIKKALM